MKRALVVLAALALIAATPNEVIPDLEANGYYIEPGASVSEEVVGDAVSDGRNAGGRLYMVVLAEEPPGGATTFSDSTLDLLPTDSFVVTVAPETVGFSENGDFWSTEEMDEAVDVSLDGRSDDEVVQLFITTLTGAGEPGVDPEPDDQGASSGGIPWGWILLIGGGGFLAWWYLSNQRQSRRTAARRMEEVKALAKEKLDEVANDILAMEHEVATSDDAEVKQHYQNASAMYSRAMEDTEQADTLPEMMKVSEELDLAIWELDCAEALLDGKEKPPKPEPPKLEPVAPPPPEPATPVPGPVPPRPSGFDRRPQRQSGESNDVMTMLLTMMAMGGMRGRGGGLGGGFGGWTSGGGSRSMGGGSRSMGGGGRSRGGGRRRG